MKQLKTVFKFEFMGYARQKSFVALTLVLVLVCGVVLSWPRIKMIGGGSQTGPDEAASVQNILVSGIEDNQEQSVSFFNDALEENGYAFKGEAGATQEELMKAVEQDEYDLALYFTGPLSYIRIVKNITITDSFDFEFDEMLRRNYQVLALEEMGLDPETSTELVNAVVESEVVAVASGKDQTRNFFYTYILIFMLYFAIIIYGQLVASSVATEKSTRAMELLITSTKPNSLMFGKVFGAGCAGLAQMALILCSGYFFYNFNAEYYRDNWIVQSIFAMPLNMMLYTLLFFVMGFFIYAFIFAALASLVSRMEDLSTAIMPVTMLFVAAFMIVMFSMGSGNVDSPLMVFCSFFPLTSPMAMFVRIALGEVASWQVLVSVIILAASTVGIGMFSASLYRLGVLLYGNPPKPKEIIRMLKVQRKENA